MADLPNNPDLLYRDLEALKSDADFQEKGIELKRWLFDQRLTYAWNSFDFHAKQRMSMFNYFLIFVGFVLSAYATLLKDGNRLVSSFLALAAVVLTKFFLHLERRNEELVYIAEDVLTSLEGDVLFAGYDRKIPWPHRRKGLLGKMNRTADDAARPSGIFRRQEAENKDKSVRFSKNEHGTWLPGIQIVILAIFALLVFVPWLPKSITVCHHAIQLRIETSK